MKKRIKDFLVRLLNRIMPYKVIVTARIDAMSGYFDHGDGTASVSYHPSNPSTSTSCFFSKRGAMKNIENKEGYENDFVRINKITNGGKTFHVDWDLD